MPKLIRYHPLTIAAAVRAFVEGQSYPDIARQYGIRRTALRHHLRAASVPPRPPNRPRVIRLIPEPVRKGPPKRTITLGELPAVGTMSYYDSIIQIAQTR